MRRTTILIVDDYGPWRSMLRSQLKTHSDFCLIAEACDGCEAVEKTAQLHPDVVLLDIGMPLLNGLEAAPRIRRESPASKIIFLTQEQDNDVRTAALATGAESYLLKSEAAAELVSAIYAALGNAQQIPPVLSPAYGYGTGIGLFQGDSAAPELSHDVQKSMSTAQQSENGA